MQNKKFDKYANAERLTKHIPSGTDIFGAPLVGGYFLIDESPGSNHIHAIHKLGRYEDTGLTPVQIEEIKKSETMKSIKQLAREVHQNAVAHGWWDNGERNVGELLMLCVSELAEAFEEYRNGREMTERYYSKDKQGNDKMEGIPSELADTVIRIMDLCEYYGIDLESVIIKKHEYNQSRPYRHGGKKC